jgi:hypothetical protein
MVDGGSNGGVAVAFNAADFCGARKTPGRRVGFTRAAARLFQAMT